MANEIYIYENMYLVMFAARMRAYLPGGFVYRGQRYADLLGGNYIFADYTNR